jgi:RNA polymerase sigma-70 factor (ECF subfamily)
MQHQRIEAQIVVLIPALRAFARTLQRSPAEADDLVQDTLVRALSHLDQFHEGTNIKSWLFTIMRNAFCTRYRIAERERPGLTECIASTKSVPPDQEWRLRGRELEAACGGLPQPYREVFAFVFIEGHSYEDAAAHFECPVGTIKSRVNRARQRIAHAVGEIPESD